MRTRTKVVIDEWLGRSLVFLLNILARLLGSILRIDHGFERIPKRIVVCKFLGMGSIIQSTPLLATIRRNFPDAKICFVTSLANQPLIKTIDLIDEGWVVDDRSFFAVISSTLNLLFRCWKNRVDWYIDLETYSYYSTAVATLSCARNRLGFYRVERNIRLGVYTHMMFFNSRAPIAQAYLQMARLAGCKEIISELFPFKIQNECLVSVKKKLGSFGIPDSTKYVVINPNASDLRIERRWPYKNFILLTEKLRTAFPDYYFLMIGSANEYSWVKMIHSAIPETTRSKVINTAGQFSLQELFALIANAELVITNDTGPMHISFALKKRTVCLFGPASPVQYGQNPFAYGLYENVYCSPCVHDFISPPCKGDNQCMKRISDQQVVTLCIKLLSSESVSSDSGYSQDMKFEKISEKDSLGIVERN